MTLDKTRIIGTLASAIVGAVLIIGAVTPARGETRVTLREGTNLAVSADHDGQRMSFSLVGRIWLADTDNGLASALTAPRTGNPRPALSPDGQMIAFEARVGNYHQIMLLDVSGGQTRQLTFGEYQHHAPSWHPDGRRLLMSSDRGGDYGIWELDLDTLGLRQLSFLPGDERDAAYNRRGDRLAFVQRIGNSEQLLVREADGRVTRLLSETGGQLHGPAWRPDESLISFTYRSAGISELRMAILSDPPVVKPLTRGENVFPFAAQWIDRDQFIYAADGRIRRRAFDAFESIDLPFTATVSLPQQAISDAAVRPALLDAAGPVRGLTGVVQRTDGLYVNALGDIWELDASGVATRLVTSESFVDTDLDGSPTDDRLAFSSDRSGSLQIWLLDPAGEQRQLTDEPGLAFGPVWSPDGQAIAYLTTDHPAASNLRLKRVDLATGATATLGQSLPEVLAIGWLPGGQVAVLPATAEMEQPRNRPPALLAFDGASPLPFSIPLPLPPGSEISAARWSPSGEQLALVADGSLQVLRLGDGGYRAADGIIAQGASLPRWGREPDSLLFVDARGTLQQATPGRASPQSLPIQLTTRTRVGESTLLIRAGRVFDGLGPGYLTSQDILIRDGRIQSVSPSGPVPAGAEVLDATELTVMPGLIDMSVRQRWPQGDAAGRSWLAWGVTTIREWSDGGPNVLERQESWNSGRRPGPRLVIGQQLCPSSDAQAGRQLARALELGAQTVEVCASLAGELQGTLIGMAHARGLRVSVAAPFPGILQGADEISLSGRGEILETYPGAFDRFAYGDLIELAGAAGLTAVSRLAIAGLPDLALGDDALAEDPRYLRLVAPTQRYWYSESWRRQALIAGPALRAEQRTAGQSAIRAVGRGARLVAGSDAPVTPWGLGLHAELRLLVASGLQPFEALRMATLDAARGLGLGDEIGRVAAGRRADLVLVAGDPLADIRAAARVATTVVAGRVVPLETLVPGLDVGKLYNPASDRGAITQSVSGLTHADEQAPAGAESRRVAVPQLKRYLPTEP